MTLAQMFIGTSNVDMENKDWRGINIKHSCQKRRGHVFCCSWDNLEWLMCGRIVIIRGEGDLCLPRALDRKLPNNTVVIMA